MKNKLTPVKYHYDSYKMHLRLSDIEELGDEQCDYHKRTALSHLISAQKFNNQK